MTHNFRDSKRFSRSAVLLAIAVPASTGFGKPGDVSRLQSYAQETPLGLKSKPTKP